MPLIFLQYCPVGCIVSGNLSERVFLGGLDFVMTGTLNYNRIESSKSNSIVSRRSVVVKVVVPVKKERGFIALSPFYRSIWGG